MLRQFFLLCATVFFSIHSFASLASTSDEKIREELTGVKRPTVQQIAMTTSLASRYLSAGREAFEKKDFLEAIKHYNSALLSRATPVESRSIYLAKAELYSAMHLPEQAQRNIQLAEKIKIIK